MDEFDPSFILISLENAQTGAATSSLFSTSPSSSSPSAGPSPSSPPVDMEYVHGNGTYSWCTIA
ncbi:hypothetical protein C8Q79DRAFT_932949 [Trametes meyenii]|nr:hypothetical protein C8Q79DRAFT_932949 [Trametes meyenii]